jgi:hypothetical protein
MFCHLNFSVHTIFICYCCFLSAVHTHVSSSSVIFLVEIHN